MTQGYGVLDTPRPRLTRHPAVVDCVRIIASMTNTRCDVIVFEDTRGFVVASSDVYAMLQPRVLTASELAVRSADDHNTTVSIDGTTAVGFVDPSGRVVGAITSWSVGAIETDGWLGFARLITGLLASPDRTESFFEAAVQGLRDAVIVLSPNMDIVWANEAVGSLLGRSPTEAIGRSAADYLHPDDIPPTVEAIARIQRGLELYRLTVRLSSANGEWVPVEVTGVDHSGDQLLGGIVLSLRYSDYDGELGVEIERVERVSKAIVTGLRDGIVATDQFGALTVVNPVARAMFGIAPETPVSSLSLSDFVLLDSECRRRPLELETLVDGAQTESQIIGDDGQVTYVVTAGRSVQAEDGRTIGTVITFDDVTAERLAREELVTQALHDQLTGLANRRQLDTRLSELAELEPATTVAACFIDLDGFKLVNDNHGHRVGDLLIGVAAQRLQSQLRAGDLLVRHGGDEFVALLVDAGSPEAVEAIADRCLAVLSEPYQIGHERFDLTASIGVALAGSETVDDGVLLQHADIALYAAKNSGRNRVELFSDSLADAVGLEERHRHLLRDAIDSNRLSTHFQPLIDALTGNTVGYEALARITTRDGEVIGPSEFMDSIANSGLMWELDQVAFAFACEAATQLEAASDGTPPFIACNFSSISITHPHFLTFIDRMLDETKVDSSQLCIEITESAAFEVGEAGTHVLRELNRRGIRLALDDFGTGYSSLVHLRDLPISTVKVDRSFIAKLADHESERAIAEAIVTLAKDLDLSTVAEGVETAEHEVEVQALGFAALQGWHYAEALPLSECLAHWKLER